MSETIIGVLLGAALAMLTQFVTLRLRDRTEKRRVRGDKLVELIGSLCEVEGWLAKHEAYQVGEVSREELIPPPTVKAMAITTVYFPEFLDRVSELDSLLYPSAQSDSHTDVMDKLQKLLKDLQAAGEQFRQ